MEKEKPGVKKTELDWAQLNKYLGLGANLMDCSELIGWSEDKIQLDIKKKFNCTFTEYRKKKMVKIRQALFQKQLSVAMSGNVTMLIWLGKQLLDQTEKIQEVVTEGSPDKKLVIVLENK